MEGLKLKILLIIIGFFYAALPGAAQSLKVPFAALSPTYAPLWIGDQPAFLRSTDWTYSWFIFRRAP